MKNNCPPNI